MPGSLASAFGPPGAVWFGVVAAVAVGPSFAGRVAFGFGWRSLEGVDNWPFELQDKIFNEMYYSFVFLSRNSFSS